MPTVDNKVVQMTFKNEQFERGVRQSVRSLEELKKALDLDKSAESLQNLEKIAGSFDISGIAQGIDNIADKFSLLGNVGQEIFRRISRTAVDAMQNVVHTITSMPQAGLSKYEQKNKAIQMIQSAMPEKTLEEIEAVLAELNDYTDLTSYDFSQMANSIGKFVSAGVDLKTAEKVMEGIANEAASAGGEIQQANIAMYNFSQALAAGSVKLLDWRSIQNQNLDTKEFKEEIIKTAIAMGTLGKVSDNVGYIMKGTGKKAKKVLVDYKSFANTLSEGWFTSDVMVKVFEKYADRESDVGKKGFEAAKVAITLSQAFEAVKDAISTGWMQSFQYLFGNLEEASDLFTRISDALIDFTDQISSARNALLEGWHIGGEDGISGYQKVIEGLSNTWAVLMGIVEAGKQAFQQVFGILDSSGLIEASKAFADFTGKMRDFFGITKETKKSVEWVEAKVRLVPHFTKTLQKGAKDSKNEIKSLQEDLLRLKKDYIKLDKYGADGIFGPETEAAVKAFQKSVGLKETGIYDEKTAEELTKALYPNGGGTKKVIKEREETITREGEGVKKLKGVFEGFAAVAKAVTGIMSFGLQIFNRVYKAMYPVIIGVEEMASGLGRLISFLVDVFGKLGVGQKILETFDKVFAPIKKVLAFVGHILIVVGNGLSDIIVTARKGVKSFEELGEKLMLNPKVNANGIKLYNILVKLKKIGETVAPVFSMIWNTAKTAFSAIATWLNGKIAAGLTAISDFFTNLWNGTDKTALLEGVLKGISTALQIIMAVIGGVGYGLATLIGAIANGAVALFNFVKNSELLKNVWENLKTFFAPVKDFFTSVGDSLRKVFPKLGSAKNFTQIWNSFINNLNLDPIGKKFVEPLQKIKGVIETPIKKFKEFAGALHIVFASLKANGGDPFKALNVLKFLRTTDKTKKAISILETIVKIKNVIDTIGGAVGKAKSAVSNFLAKVMPGLKDFGAQVVKSIGDFFGGDGKSPGEKIATGFGTIKDKLASLFGKLGTWFATFVKNSPFLQKLQAFGTMIGAAVKNFFTMDTSGIGDIGEKLKARLKSFDGVIQWFKDRITDIKAIFSDPDKLLSHVVGFFKGVGSFIINIFKNFNISQLWDATKFALGTYIMMSLAKSMKNFSKSFGVLTGAIDEKEAKSGIADKLRSIAITIGIITAALAALAFIPADKAFDGVVVMTFALTAVTASLVALNKFAPGLEGLGKGLLAMALSIGIVIAGIFAAMKLVEGKKLKDMAPALGLVAGIMLALIGVSYLMGKFKKKSIGSSKGSSNSILAMCAGLFLVVLAVEKMIKVLDNNKNNTNNIKKSLAAIAGILAVLGLIAIGMAKFGKSGADGKGATGIAPTILAITTTLSMVVSSVGKMAKLIKNNPNEIGWAYAAIEGMLITIGAIAVLLAKFSGENDKWTSLFSAAPILAIGWMVDKTVSVMAEAIAMISDKNVDPKVLETFFNGVDVAFAIFAGTIKLFSKINIGEFLKVAVGIVAVLGAIGLGLDLAATFTSDAMDKMSSALELVGFRMKFFSDSMTQVDSNAINIGMDVLVNKILPSIGSMVTNASTVESALPVADNIRMIGIRLNAFQRNISSITEDPINTVQKIPNAIKNIVDTINNIEGIDAAKQTLYDLGGALKTYFGDLAAAQAGSEANVGTDTGDFDVNKANEAFQHLADLTLSDETIAKIKSYADGGDSSLGGFVGGIANLGTALKQYGEDINTIDAGKVETANGILDKVKDIETHLNPATEINFDMFSGKRQNIKDFGDDIAALGTSLGQYADSVATLNPGKIIMGNVVMDAVARLNTILPKTGGLWQMVTGEKSLSTFAVNMGDLGLGMANYANSISGASFGNVNESLPAIEAIAKAQSILQRTGGVKEVAEGAANLGKLGTGLADLGVDLAAFANGAAGIKTLKDADFDKINRALEPLSKLAYAQSILQRIGGLGEKLNGVVSLDQLGAGLVGFGSKLIEFQGNIQQFNADDSKVNSAIALIDSITHMQERIQNGYGTYDFTDVRSGLSALLSEIETFFDSESKTTVAERVIEIFSFIGKNIDTGIATGVNDEAAKKQVTDAVQAIADTVANNLGTNISSQAFVWGYHLVKNMADGITSFSGLMTRAVEGIANIIHAYLHFTLPDVGPLKNMDKWMPDMMQNLANGITDNLGVVDQASNTAGGTIASNIKDSVLQMLTSAFDGEEGPTITPIFDLSNVETAIDEVKNIFGGETITADTQLSNSISRGMGSTTIIQGGNLQIDSTEIVNRIDNLEKSIANMTATMTNLRVVMNTGALVGQLIGPIDARLGARANQRT